MIPCDADDIEKEYEILLNELTTFNPELLDKGRVLAVTKCDMLDEELMEMLKSTLHINIPIVFISSVTGFGIDTLKDLLWTEMNRESNKIAALRTQETIVHQPKDFRNLQKELEASGESVEYVESIDVNDSLLDYDEIDDIESVEYL